MKCPKCGFVSFPGLDQCKKCGHRFTVVGFQTRGTPPLFRQPPTEAKASTLPDVDLSQDHSETGGQAASKLDRAMEPGGTFSGSTEQKKDPPAPGASPAKDLSAWQIELAERVQEYRQKRARLAKSDEAGGKTLDFDFGPSAPAPEETQPNVIEFPPAEETPRHTNSSPDVRSAPPSLGLDDFEPPAAPPDLEASFPVETKAKPSAETAPLEIEFGSSQQDSSAGDGEEDPSGVPGAPMNLRFFAGAIDFLVLLSGAAVYALIFRQVGGSFSPQPVVLATAAVIGAFFILLYFGGCTALASATPGLIWAGLEVTTFEGNPPRLADCLWRAFGYLVSISAIMMGFVWAVVDADGLTWHDRMSSTFIVPADHP